MLHPDRQASSIRHRVTVWAVGSANLASSESGKKNLPPFPRQKPNGRAGQAQRGSTSDRRKRPAAQGYLARPEGVMAERSAASPRKSREKQAGPAPRHPLLRPVAALPLSVGFIRQPNDGLAVRAFAGSVRGGPFPAIGIDQVGQAFQLGHCFLLWSPFQFRRVPPEGRRFQIRYIRRSGPRQ